MPQQGLEESKSWMSKESKEYQTQPLFLKRISFHNNYSGPMKQSLETSKCFNHEFPNKNWKESADK